MAGKGDNRRPEDTKKIDSNWSSINWKSDKSDKQTKEEQDDNDRRK